MTHYAYSPFTGEFIDTDNPSDWMALTDTAPPEFNRSIEGCFFRDGAWVIVAPEPETPPPLICSAWQIREALNQLGWRAEVEAAVAASGNAKMQDAWQYALQYHSNNPLIVNMGLALGKTDAEMLALFELAVTLTLS